MTLEMLTQDVRVACRGLLRTKGFTGAAVLTLMTGIAGTTVMFALIEGVLLRRLPVRDQDRLIVAWKALRLSASLETRRNPSHADRWSMCRSCNTRCLSSASS
jgi:hypothetical protein